MFECHKLRACLIALLIAVSWPLAAAAQASVSVQVADPFLEMHSGPDDGYPAFQVIKRGESVEILERKTDWFRVRSPQGKEGWVPRSQLEKTLTAEGLPTRFTDATADDYQGRRWELGLLGGSMDGGRAISTFGGFALTRKLSTELALTHVLGDYSSSLLLSARLLATPFPAWKLAPFLALGGGLIHTAPDATLVEAKDRTDNLAHVGVGLRSYVSRRFVLRLEYNSYTVFSGNEHNEDPEEWKAGFAVFF
jgi:hypothetical protein